MFEMFLLKQKKTQFHYFNKTKTKYKSKSVASRLLYLIQRMLAQQNAVI